jgi:inner membrane protein
VDNITHSLTGALAAKVVEKHGAPGDRGVYRHTLFWLFVLCANLPDIDVALGLFGGRLFSLQHHRGITHSLVCAPLLSIIPAALFYIFGKLKSFRILWLFAFAGIVVHIFFDLITAYGTQIFAPISAARYSLDWMFIIDPVFTLFLAVTLLLGKLISKRKRQLIVGGTVFLLLYLFVEAVSHRVAYTQIKAFVEKRGIVATKISALPQPLSVFRWMGLVQTENSVLQTFLTTVGKDDTLTFTEYKIASDEFVRNALETVEGKSYMTFARHPWIRSFEKEGRQVVEFRDLQFSIDRAILRTVGFTERSLPFVLLFTFSSDGEILDVTLDGGSVVPRQER